MLVQIEPQLAEQNIYSGCSNICKLLLTVCASGVQVLLMYSLSLSGTVSLLNYHASNWLTIGEIRIGCKSYSLTQ